VARPEARPWADRHGGGDLRSCARAVPWIAFIVGPRLDLGRTGARGRSGANRRPWRVLLSSPCRARGRAGCGGAVRRGQTAGEISVTDMMLVSTLAEEVHTQFTLGDPPRRPGAHARRIVAGLLVAWTGLCAVLSYVERTLPAAGGRRPQVASAGS